MNERMEKRYEKERLIPQCGPNPIREAPPGTNTESGCIINKARQAKLPSLIGMVRDSPYVFKS